MVGMPKVVSCLTHISQYRLFLVVLLYTSHRLEQEQLSFWLLVLTMFHHLCLLFFCPYFELRSMLLTFSHNTNVLEDTANFLLNTHYFLLLPSLFLPVAYLHVPELFSNGCY